MIRFFGIYFIVGSPLTIETCNYSFVMEKTHWERQELPFRGPRLRDSNIRRIINHHKVFESVFESVIVWNQMKRNPCDKECSEYKFKRSSEHEDITSARDMQCWALLGGGSTHRYKVRGTGSTG